MSTGVQNDGATGLRRLNEAVLLRGDVILTTKTGAVRFRSIESCGKCRPCRIGLIRGVEVIDGIISDERRTENLTLLQELCETMRSGSLCALGGFVPFPVLTALTHFPADFDGARVSAAAA